MLLTNQKTINYENLTIQSKLPLCFVSTNVDSFLNYSQQKINFNIFLSKITLLQRCMLNIM